MSPLLASMGITDLHPHMIDAHFILDRIKNATGKFSSPTRIERAFS